MSATRSTSAFSDLPGIRLGVVRGISYGLFGKPDEFVRPARSLGAGLVRAYVYWSQVEPRPGHWRWEAVDAVLEQLDGDEEVWITLCSSSPWGTRQPTDFLPPSPARDQRAYGEFVRQVVRRCSGRVRYWQCDNEPSNTDLLWAGTAAEYVTQLATMSAAVREVDPDAAVVLGGCGYDLLSSPEGSPERQFFGAVLSAGRDDFDLFDVHLYGDTAKAPGYLATARELLRAHGCGQPIVVGEYAAPVPFDFPEAEAAMFQALASAFAEAPPTQRTDELIERERQETPERRAMTALYERMAELPPKLQMFLVGCPPELEAKRHRINARQLVTCNLVALAEGVRRTVYWDLAPEVPAAVDPRQVMHLMFGKLALLGYDGPTLGTRRPAASAFALLASQLAGAARVTRVEAAGQPTVAAFQVDRAGRAPLLVLWDQRDLFDGEAEPPVLVEWPWAAGTAGAVDALGGSVAADVRDGTLRLPVSVTPVFVSA